MDPSSQVVVNLDCGARVVVRVIVDPAQCRRRDGRCLTGAHVASLIWFALCDAELEEFRVQDSPTDRRKE